MLIVMSHIAVIVIGCVFIAVLIDLIRNGNRVVGYG